MFVIWIWNGAKYQCFAEVQILRSEKKVSLVEMKRVGSEINQLKSNTSTTYAEYGLCGTFWLSTRFIFIRALFEWCHILIF